MASTALKAGAVWMNDRKDVGSILGGGGGVGVGGHKRKKGLFGGGARQK